MLEIVMIEWLAFASNWGLYRVIYEALFVAVGLPWLLSIWHGARRERVAQ